MKRIDEFDKLPGDDARIAKLKRSLMAVAPQNNNDYRKQEHYGPLERREKALQKGRRSFLDMMGKAGISTQLLKVSPLLGGMMATRHAAAQGVSNKRVVYCYMNSGAQNDKFLPTSATNMNVVTKPYGDQGVANICNFRQVNVMQEGHANATQAIGVPGYGIPTMDARIAGVLGATTPYSAVYLGSQATTSGVLCSTLGPCTDDPAKAFSDLFKAPPPTVATDDTYKTAFNSQLSAIERIKAKLGGEETARLETHVDALVKMQTNMEAQLSGEGPDVASCGGEVGAVNNSNIQARGRSQADIIVAALQCGLTNVATLQLGNHQGDWYGHNTAYKGDAHNSCHSAGGETNDELVRYLTDVPAYFLSKLMSTEGPDGLPLIQTTVFVQVTCMGNGRDHSRENGPFMVATQMPGFSNSFSAASGGTTEDLNGAIPRGLGIEGMLQGMGSDDLGLLR